MTTIGQVERRTQQRIAKLFTDPPQAGGLGYAHLGDWTDRDGNRNVEEQHFRAALQQRGVGNDLISRAWHILSSAAGNLTLSLYDRNREFYALLRYGVKVRTGAGETTETVWPIDWQHPENNHFAIAEEVTILAADARGHTKRPDIVLYVNGIALGVIELKRSTVSVAEGIRQNLDNQKREFIEHFFATMQLVMAGNDTEGLRYGTIQTPEKHYLAWQQTPAGESPLDYAVRELCSKQRFLELIHDFIVFDAGTKKVCRHNQYFGVRAAQERVRRREGGIIWHTQGSGKSLTMVWLTKWLRENAERNGKKDARVLIITDRMELDEQIERVFKGVNEDIYRTKSCADLIEKLNATTPWLLCSLIHKFGAREEDEEVGDIPGYIADLKKALPPGFAPKGDLYVYVDECHRTQSGMLHDAMKAILPHAMFIGFTGTPLLKADKKKSIEVFGSYIHTYKYHEAVRDGVVLDLRYEARDIDQHITAQEKIDQWFELKTRGLTPLAKAQLKLRWGNLQKVLSCKDRLEKIANDILFDMETRDRLQSGRGNALLVAGSIYEACKFFEIFARTDLKGKCAIITSYVPAAAQIKGEESGEGETEALHKFAIYRQMLADWFNVAPEAAVNRVEEFERQVKKKFINEPGQMKLLIVVDKLLTGFDAPPATYLYIDKQMRDHGLFQAICRVNRLDGDDKEFGCIIDYKDLFKSLEGAVKDYTSGALDGYDREDVAGVLQDRLQKAKDELTAALEAVRALCEPVAAPKQQADYFRYFSAAEQGNAEQLKANEPQRVTLYKQVGKLVRAYAQLAAEMTPAGYSAAEAAAIEREVAFYEKLRAEIKLHSGDAIDLKMYEPAMRHLIDSYIRADDSRKVSAFDDLSLVQLLVERGGAAAAEALPAGLRGDQKAAAETIVNNVRRRIMEERPLNPKYYDTMSTLLEALLQQRRTEAIAYQKFLDEVANLARQVVQPQTSGTYPLRVDTPGKRALYDNLDGNEPLALAIDAAVRETRQDNWRGNPLKVKAVRKAIAEAVAGTAAATGVAEATPAAARDAAVAARIERILELVQQQHEY